MNNLTKKCSKCGIDKELSEFNYRKDSNTYRNECKTCKSLIFKKYCEGNKEKLKIQQKLYNEKHKEKLKIQAKLYREKNKEKITLQKKLYTKLHYEKNKEKINLQGKLYYEKNKEKVKLRQTLYNEKNKEHRNLQAKLYREKNKENRRLYIQNKLKTDINYKLSKLFRRRILLAIKKQCGIKAYRSKELLGCTIEEARTHLESQFKLGMTWDNHGKWHIDHIIPCSVFDLTDPVEQKQCFHYTNLQPLWAEENLSKSDKIIYDNRIIYANA